MKFATRRLACLTLMWMFAIGFCAAAPNQVDKLSAKSASSVEVPESSSDSWYVYLNDCQLIDQGFAKAGEKLSLPVSRYGDIFYVDRFLGGSAQFVHHLAILKMVGKRGCYAKDGLAERKELYGKYSASKAAEAIVSAFDRVSRDDKTVDWKLMMDSFKSIGMCPTKRPTANQMSFLENCLDMDALRADVMVVAADLEEYPIIPVTSLGIDGVANRYSKRKEFSTLTVKTGFAFAPAADTGVTTAVVSLYPTVAFLTSEKLVYWLDRVSFDIGVAKRAGETGDTRLKNGTNYLVGIGFDLSDKISLMAGDVMHFEKSEQSKTHHVFYIGLSLDLLSTLAGANQ